MSPPLRHITVDHLGDVTYVGLKKHHLGESEVLELADEVVGLIHGGCRKMAFSLGPGALECLFSVFLAKLVMFQRVLRERGGALVLCDVTPEVLGVFKACRLDELFQFAPDRCGAAAALGQES